MFIIWRGWGWLTLVFVLAAWWLADTPIAAIYRAVAYGDPEAGLYNAEKAICWAIALIVVAIPFAALAFWRRHAERPRTPEEVAAEDRARLAAIADLERARVEGGGQPDPTSQAYLAGTMPLPPVVRPRSSFFFIPFWILPFGFVAIAVVALVLNVPTAITEAR